MHSPTTLLNLYLMAFAATATYAAVDPLYSIPGRVQQENYVETDYTQCQGSTFDVIGDGDILISDCQAILDDLEGRSGFIMRLTLWQNSTGLEDHFWTYVTSGSCQFALKRVDGLDTTVFIGNTDIKNLFNQSISLGNGTHAQTVEGVIPCLMLTEVGDPFAKIEWSIRQTGKVN